MICKWDLGPKVSYRRPDTTLVPLRPRLAGKVLREPSPRPDVHFNAPWRECSVSGVPWHRPAIPHDSPGRGSPGLNNPYPTYTLCHSLQGTPQNKHPVCPEENTLLLSGSLRACGHTYLLTTLLWNYLATCSASQPTCKRRPLQWRRWHL